MTDSELETKFRRLARRVLADAQIDRLLSRLGALETLDDAGEILKLTVPD